MIRKFYVLTDSKCPDCDGGIIRYPAERDCPRCNGTGSIATMHPLAEALAEMQGSKNDDGRSPEQLGREVAALRAQLRQARAALFEFLPILEDYERDVAVWGIGLDEMQFPVTKYYHSEDDVLKNFDEYAAALQ